MATSKQKADLKIIILGASEVGKTCLIQRYLHGTFESTKQTLGASFFLKEWDGYHVAIWDTAGEERYHSLSSFYARNASAAIFAYDITDLGSFHALQERFLRLLESANPQCLCAVVACKTDLVTGRGRERGVEPAMAKQFAREHNESRGTELPSHCRAWDNAYFETSSKTGEGVVAVFDFLRTSLLAKMPTPSNEAANTLPPNLAATLSMADRSRAGDKQTDGGTAKAGCCS